MSDADSLVLAPLRPIDARFDTIEAELDGRLTVPVQQPESLTAA